jgi:hypothetical protein
MAHRYNAFVSKPREDSRDSLPPSWRWTQRIAKLLFLLVILLCVIRWAWGRYADVQLNRAITENRRPGEPFFAEDFKHPPIPDSENAAVILQAAAQSIQPPGGLLSDFSEFETASGVDNAFAHLWLNSNLSILSKMRAARSKPIDWKTDFSHGLNGLYPSIPRGRSKQELRQLADLTLLAAKAAHFRRDDMETIQYWNDLLCQSRIIRKQPIWIMFLVAAKIDEATCLNIIDRASELEFPTSGPASAPQVSSLILDLLNESDLNNAQTLAFCTERWVQMEPWQTVIEGNLFTPFEQTPLAPPAAWERVVSFAINPSFKLKDARSIQFFSATLRAINANSYQAALAQLRKFPPPIRTTVFPADHVETFGDYSYNFTSSVEPLFRRRLNRRAAAMALALQLYRVDHGGALPENASLLVPKYLPALPPDPFDPTGQPIRYAPTKFGRPILYSLGPQGRDLALQNWKLPPKRISNSSAYSYVFEISPPFRGASASK